MPVQSSFITTVPAAAAPPDAAQKEPQSAAAAVHERLLKDPQVCELYIRLLCQYEPSAVLPFLQTQDAYRWVHNTSCCAGKDHQHASFAVAALESVLKQVISCFEVIAAVWYPEYCPQVYIVLMPVGNPQLCSSPCNAQDVYHTVLVLGGICMYNCHTRLYRLSI